MENQNWGNINLYQSLFYNIDTYQSFPILLTQIDSPTRVITWGFWQVKHRLKTKSKETLVLVQIRIDKD